MRLDLFRILHGPGNPRPLNKNILWILYKYILFLDNGQCNDFSFSPLPKSYLNRESHRYRRQDPLHQEFLKLYMGILSWYTGLLPIIIVVRIQGVIHTIRIRVTGLGNGLLFSPIMSRCWYSRPEPWGTWGRPGLRLIKWLRVRTSWRVGRR